MQDRQTEINKNRLNETATSLRQALCARSIEITHSVSKQLNYEFWLNKNKSNDYAYHVGPKFSNRSLVEPKNLLHPS